MIGAANGLMFNEPYMSSAYYDYASTWVGGSATINLPGGAGTVVVTGGQGTPQPYPTTTGGNGTYYTTPMREQGLVSVGMLVVLAVLAYLFMKS